MNLRCSRADPFAELNEVLARLLAEVSAILGDTLAGAYLQGSFALGDGDEQSDCDFLFVLHEEPDAERLGRLALLHDEIPARPGHRTRHLEGSYAIAGELRDLSGLGREWWYVDRHGDDCNGSQGAAGSGCDWRSPRRPLRAVSRAFTNAFLFCVFWASHSPAAHFLARAGLTARGVIYILVGWVAVLVAWRYSDTAAAAGGSAR
ncbi:MAG TPA: nucleotidyltransferase domain-containing protein [Trebonia sp.]|nr:nucleotidyltransferase domain-containing protein [Trebonia sp.]